MRLRAGCRTTKSRRLRSNSAKLSGTTGLPVGLHMPAVMCGYLAMGADRIVFASDYPFERSEYAAEYLRATYGGS
ncbi:MAG: hypothetical protein JRJ29_00825 [Deltaproteobacteria bacterium]|nr:hypothetical protein [Deltaproteobacteria bacterium]